MQAPASLRRVHEPRDAAKLRQEVSGTMRTRTGADHFADLRSYLATTARHGIDALDPLTRPTTGKPLATPINLTSYQRW